MSTAAPLLLACPCGGVPEIHSGPTGLMRVETWAQCPSCGKATDVLISEHPDHIGAAERWNSREEA